MAKSMQASRVITGKKPTRADPAEAKTTAPVTSATAASSPTSKDKAPGKRNAGAAADSKGKKAARREEDERDEQDEDAERPAAKKQKAAAKEPVKPLDPSLPTNLTFPINITFPPKKENTVRLSNWNVCGISSASKKGFAFYVKAEDADVLILTETKVEKEFESEVLKSRYPHRYWGADPKKGHSGTAVFSKIAPMSVTMGLPTLDAKTTQGRCITLEFDGHFVVATYTPNAGEKLKNLDYKNEWNAAFEKYLRELDAKKPVIWGGDFNCAPTDKDIRHAKQNWNKTPGYTQAESDAYFAQLNPDKASGHQPLVDIWRQKHPETTGQYTYYSYRFKCREKGIGWRLDSWILSERIAASATMCEIRHECYGASDHLPVVLELEGAL